MASVVVLERIGRTDGEPPPEESIRNFSWRLFEVQFTPGFFRAVVVVPTAAVPVAGPVVRLDAV
jgi:hypothetical protein